MLKVTMDTVPHTSQPYDTVGECKFLPDGLLKIDVSEMGNEDYELLVAIHEAIELWLCRKRGISYESICAFDIEFEKKRPDGDTSEPGDHPDAPYRKEHFFATSIERLIAAEMGVDWEEYDKKVNSL